MTSSDFWQSWAAAQFGAAAGSGAASLFNRYLILWTAQHHFGVKRLRIVKMRRPFELASPVPCDASPTHVTQTTQD
jgi:hypothetical protein